ncbi:MAG: NAD-dependent epimerase/dehydratase family protein [Saprospiraceae bacterium]|nr:NAD-dependent epimerase/dehydratase family protein [Saprospiraceae bacterium]
MSKDELILVTGATGFVGAYLTRMLVQSGYKVRAIRRPNSNMALLNGAETAVEWVDADVLDIVALEDAFQGVSRVFHCAAMISFLPKDSTTMLKVNVEGTANIVNLCLHFGIKKLVYVSSIAALGRTRERPHLDERSKWVNGDDNSQYALSKYQAEQEVWRGQEEGLDVAVVMPSVITGGREWDDGMAKFVPQTDRGLKVYPTGRSGFVDVRDVARFMVLLMESDVKGERFILNADNITHLEFFTLIARELGKKPPVIPVGPILMELAWRGFWVLSKLTGMTPPITRESGRASVSHYTYANEKSRAAFGGFEYISVADSVREMVKLYQEARQNGLKPMVSAV